MRLILFTLYSILITTEASKCPEPRKPHSTSCTVFYNCVNLPGGGYVWIPSKCTEGLIFQPYLRMCVLPGDSWTCDTLSTESSIITMRYDTPDSINLNETGYMGLTQDPSNFSEFIDSSYTTDSIPDTINQEMITSYPLIEIEETMETKYKAGTEDTPVTTNSQYDYLQEQSYTKQEHLMINRLMHHLLTYKEITIPLEFLASLSLPTSSKTSTSTNNRLEPSKTNERSVLMNYLIQNYIQQNNLQNTIITDTKPQSLTEPNKILKEDYGKESMIHSKTSNNMSQIQLDDLEDESNIILITDDFKHKQYVTIGKYKSMDYHVDSQFVHVIPCVKNVRMPNTTDCVKYYVCNPEEVSVIEYTCPSFTAFNKYARVCDKEAYDKCITKDQENMKFSEDSDIESQINISGKDICTEHGKTRDPTSESRYYICYSSDKLQEFNSIRMTCPNGLVFCQTKKVCTIKRLCKIT